MKINILICGLVAGVILTTFMVVSTALCYDSGEFDGNVVLGYAAMILSFSLIFVGVRNFRDRYNGGLITFGKAFQIGLFITLIASTLYVIVWLIEYYLFMPDFTEKYTAHLLRELKANGAGPAEMAQKSAELADFREMYKNPLFAVLITYSEVVPVGLVISLISALLLKRNPAGQVRPAEG